MTGRSYIIYIAAEVFLTKRVHNFNKYGTQYIFSKVILEKQFYRNTFSKTILIWLILAKSLQVTR